MIFPPHFMIDSFWTSLIAFSATSASKDQVLSFHRQNANVIHEAILIGYLKSTAASPANSDIRYTVVLFDLLSISSFSYSVLDVL